MFNKKNKTIEVDGKKIELQPKPSPFSSFLKPKLQNPKTPKNAAPTEQKNTAIPPAAVPEKKTAQQKPINYSKRPSAFNLYVQRLGAKQKGLEAILQEDNIKESLYNFVRRMVLASIFLAAVIGLSIILILLNVGMSPIIAVLLGFVIALAVFQVSLRNFLNFPMQKRKHNVKLIERDIMFAARDLIISLRSGMPLFNALTMVSTGYGEASKEFGRIVQKVQLGASLSDSIDEVLETTKSNSFKRLMLQASVSIKTGADVVAALQSIIDELSQERIIEMRKYGQRFNAIAMFYMLFGIIFPSMGIAVITILTTFISIFTVTPTLLYAALAGIVFLQIIFLELIRSSRPVFTM